MAGRGRWIHTTNVIASELQDSLDFGGVLKYAARCIRECARRTEREDRGETEVARHNMRTLATRVDRVGESLSRQTAAARRAYMKRARKTKR